MARVGFSLPAHHYPAQDISTIGIAHQHGAAQALFAGSRPHSPSPDLAAPSWESNVASFVAVWCYAAELIFGCGAVSRYNPLPRRTCIPKGASVRLCVNSFECLTHACVAGFVHHTDRQGYTGHVHCSSSLRVCNLLTGVLCVGENPSYSLLAPLSNAPPQIAVI